MQQETIELSAPEREALLDAKNLFFKMPSANEEKIKLIQQMVSKAEELHSKYEQLGLEEKLFLISLTMNLTLHFFTSKQANKQVFYFEKLNDYYQQTVCEDNILSFSQRSSWVSQIGEVFVRIDYYSQAIRYYKNVLKINLTNMPTNKLVLASCHATLADIYLKHALELKKRVDAAAIEEDKYLICIEHATISLDMDPKNIKSYLIKSRAYCYLANFYKNKKGINDILELSMQALQTAIDGMCITNSSHNQSIFIKYIIDYCDKLKKILQNFINSKNQFSQNNFPKENAVKIIKEVEKIKELLLKPNVNIDQILSIIKSINPSTKTHDYSPFWEHRLKLSTLKQTSIAENKNTDLNFFKN